MNPNVAGREVDLTANILNLLVLLPELVLRVQLEKLNGVARARHQYFVVDKKELVEHLHIQRLEMVLALLAGKPLNRHLDRYALALPEESVTVARQL